MYACLRRELLLEDLLQGLAVLGELLDALMELVERHLVLEERPAELGLVVDERHLRDRLGLGRARRVQLLRYGLARLLQLLEQCGCDREEVDTRERLNLTDLDETRQSALVG